MMLSEMRFGLVVLVLSTIVRVSSVAAYSAELQASSDRVREAAVSVLEEEGFKIARARRSTGDVTARRARVVNYKDGQSDAADELQRIAKVDPNWQADVSSLSEYYVTVMVAMRPVENEKTLIKVSAQITGAQRTRGRRGAPMPVPIESSGVLEKELVDHIQNRLTSSANSPPS
jgi:hypothetical protein